MNKILSNTLSTLAYFREQIALFGMPCLLLAILLFSSCIRDNIAPCPPLQVELSIKDKNYFNVHQSPLETPKSETLAFRAYIPTLYYTLREASTGDIVEEQGVFNVPSDGDTFPITFCNCLPLGTYILTVWGGLPDNTRLADRSLTSIIHTNGMEGNDIYLTHDTLVYEPQHAQYTVDMERVTGKLLVQITNLPTDILSSDKSINRIYERVNHLFGYQNSVTISKKETWNETTEVVMSTILAPSTGKDESLLHLDFYSVTAPNIPALIPEEVYITLKRNELTNLKYVYDKNKEDFTIYLLMRDVWEVIYDLDIK